jgi:hypothetical protein
MTITVNSGSNKIGRSIVDDEFLAASAFFAHELPAAGLAVDEGSEESVYNRADSAASAIVLPEVVPPELQKQVAEAKKRLIQLTSLGSTKMRKWITQASDPDLVFNVDAWKQIYTKYPLLAYDEVLDSRFHHSGKGVEVAQSVASALISLAVGPGGAMTAFKQFLEKMQTNIKASVEKQEAPIALFVQSISITIQGGTVIPRLNGFFITYAESKRIIDTPCASFESFEITSSYQRIGGLLDLDSLREPDIMKKWDDLMAQAALDDIENSQDFFEDDEGFVPSK